MDIIKDRNIKGGKAVPKVRGGYGIEDYYKFYKKGKGMLDTVSFSRIIKSVNKAMVEEVIESAEAFPLPYGMGIIEFRKVKNKAIKTDEGIISNTPVDWQKTMALWEKSPVAYKSKVMVKYSNMHTGRYSFRIRCYSRKFKNKEYFQMTYKRSFKRAFAKRIMTYNKPKIEAYVTNTH